MAIDHDMIRADQLARRAGKASSSRLEARLRALDAILKNRPTMNGRTPNIGLPSLGMQAVMLGDFLHDAEVAEDSHSVTSIGGEEDEEEDPGDRPAETVNLNPRSFRPRARGLTGEEVDNMNRYGHPHPTDELRASVDGPTINFEDPVYSEEIPIPGEGRLGGRVRIEGRRPGEVPLSQRPIPQSSWLDEADRISPHTHQAQGEPGHHFVVGDPIKLNGAGRAVPTEAGEVAVGVLTRFDARPGAYPVVYFDPVDEYTAEDEQGSAPILSPSPAEDFVAARVARETERTLLERFTNTDLGEPFEDDTAQLPQRIREHANRGVQQAIEEVLALVPTAQVGTDGEVYALLDFDVEGMFSCGCASDETLRLECPLFSAEHRCDGCGITWVYAENWHRVRPIGDPVGGFLDRHGWARPGDRAVVDMDGRAVCPVSLAIIASTGGLSDPGRARTRKILYHRVGVSGPEVALGGVS